MIGTRHHKAEIAAAAPEEEEEEEEAPDAGKLTQSLRLTVKVLAQDGELRLRPEVRLVQPIREDAYYKDDRQRHLVVHAVARRAQDRNAQAALSDLAICGQACLSLRSRCAVGSSWLRAVLRRWL